MNFIAELKKQISQSLGFGESVRQQILHWISPIHFNDKQADVIKVVQPNAGQWFIATAGFQRWLHAEENTPLWCPGIRMFYS
jgi:hypothetical protein